jgi:hypothetical protein
MSKAQTIPSLPESVTFVHSPNYRGTLINLRLEPNANVPGNFDLVGIVSEGTVTDRLFACSSTSSIAGETFRIYGVAQDEIARGHIYRALCG